MGARQGREEGMTSRMRGTQRPGIVFRGVESRAKRPPLKPGQVPCPACGRGTRIKSDGLLRRHDDLNGLTCYNRRPDLKMDTHLEEIPDVVVSTPSWKNGRKPREPGPTARTGFCVTEGCGKFIGPDRLYCGPCLAKRL